MVKLLYRLDFVIGIVLQMRGKVKAFLQKKRTRRAFFLTSYPLCAIIEKRITEGRKEA
jgi:hypothetical protein